MLGIYTITLIQGLYTGNYYISNYSLTSGLIYNTFINTKQVVFRNIYKGPLSPSFHAAFCPGDRLTAGCPSPAPRLSGFSGMALQYTRNEWLLCRFDVNYERIVNNWAFLLENLTFRIP